MLKKRRKHEKVFDYAVRFIGYSAWIIARKGNAEYATLNFVGGVAALLANQGHLLAPDRSALSFAVVDLPSWVDELKSLAKSVSLDSAGHRVLRRGEIEICISQDADVERFVSQIARRYRVIEPILEQAEEIGSEIERPPYDDHIYEIRRTGTSIVMFYGDALFVDGKLTYYPDRQTLLVRPIGDGQTFEVSELMRNQIGRDDLRLHWDSCQGTSPTRGSFRFRTSRPLSSTA
jgi:hypothetical protein